MFPHDWKRKSIKGPFPVWQVFFGKLINSLGTYYDQPIILADKVNKVGIPTPCPYPGFRFEDDIGPRRYFDVTRLRTCKQVPPNRKSASVFLQGFKEDSLLPDALGPQFHHRPLFEYQIALSQLLTVLKEIFLPEIFEISPSAC